MSSIRPVLLVGPEDFSRLVAALRRHALGALIAPDVQTALRMLRHFRVDVILTTVTDTEDLARLTTHNARTPVVFMGVDPQSARDAGCVGVIAEAAAPPVLADLLHFVGSRERSVQQTEVA